MPKETAHSYKCLFDPALGPDAGVPCSQHTLQDHKKFMSNCKEIYNKQGVLVRGLRSRKGHQKENMVGNANANHGRAQEKLSYVKNLGCIQMLQAFLLCFGTHQEEDGTR